MKNQLAIRLEGDSVCVGDHFQLCFQRTLRIPDDGRVYPLPPGLGTFPVRRVDDFAERVPSDWLEHGGVFLPMFQREAMWLSFSAPVPHAVKVAVGKVCALTGKRWREHLHRRPQDYLVAPKQPWLDGICAGKGRIRQFVAMPLGMGYTVEGQVTGEERFGGVQVKVFAPEQGRFTDPERSRFSEACAGGPPPGSMPPAPGACPTMMASDAPFACAAPSGPYRGSARRSRQASGSMGLGAGGRMKQKIYPDPYGIDAWDPDRTGRLYIHIVNSELWRDITGEAPPPSPVTARAYAQNGLPWFDLYDEQAATLPATDPLKAVQSIKQIDSQHSTLPLADDDSVQVGPIKQLIEKANGLFGVRDGDW